MCGQKSLCECICACVCVLDPYHETCINLRNVVLDSSFEKEIQPIIHQTRRILSPHTVHHATKPRHPSPLLPIPRPASQHSLNTSLNSFHTYTNHYPTQIIILQHSLDNPLHTTALTAYTHLPICHTTTSHKFTVLSTRPQPNSKHLPHNTRSAAPLSR